MQNTTLSGRELLAALGIVGAAAGIFGALINTGLISANVLPSWLRGALNI